MTVRLMSQIFFSDVRDGHTQIHNGFQTNTKMSNEFCDHKFSMRFLCRVFLPHFMFVRTFSKCHAFRWPNSMYRKYEKYYRTKMKNIAIFYEKKPAFSGCNIVQILACSSDLNKKQQQF